MNSRNSSRGFWSVISQEIQGSLPGRHRKSQFLPPDQDLAEGFDDIRTGAKQGNQIVSISLKLFGYLTWIIWFGFGTRFWWFSNTQAIEFLVATILWMLSFAFTILGIPITRALLGLRRAR